METFSAPTPGLPPAGDPALAATLADLARLAALRATELLDAPPDAALDRLTRLATRFLGAPVALISLVDDERQFFTSCVGLPDPWASARETPLSHSFCQHVVHRREPFVVHDARAHPLVRDNLAIRDLGVVAYLGVPLRLASGHVLGSLCLIDHVPRRWTDDELAALSDLAGAAVTELELRAALRATEAARDEAAVANRAKDAFLALVSHELRSPLAGIASNAQMLAMGVCGPLTEGQTRALERIRTSQGHLAGLIDQLLDLKCAATGRQEIALARVGVAAAMADAAALVEATMDERALRFDVRLPDPALAAHADPDKLRQVLLNLLGNASKFTPAGGAVELACDADGAAVRLHVRDTGVGIPADMLGPVFEPFVQVPDARRPSVRGTGLGLTICRDLARAMGGEVTARSTHGAGATFTVVLRSA